MTWIGDPTFSKASHVQFYKALPKTHKNGHEATNSANLTKKNPKISMCATKPFIDLTYEHRKVEVKQISYEFNC